MPNEHSSSLPAGSTIGIVGGGQLGRMLAMAAARLGYHTIVLEPDEKCPAMQVSSSQITATYDDPDAIDTLGVLCDVITYEFENVPLETARTLASKTPVFPPPAALEIAQDRLVEKNFLNDCGIATARFVAIDGQQELENALSEMGGRGVLKTRRLGYDGKGQIMFNGPEDDPQGAFGQLGSVPQILESLVPFVAEISIIAARDRAGSIVSYDPSRNHHKSGILHLSTVPSGVPQEAISAAQQAAASILTRLDYVGVIGVEFFVMEDGSILANELAPRVHNSGHWTEAACAVSQFEQHIRAICGLPLADCHRHSDCEMENIIGEDVQRIGQMLLEKDAVLHMYGKSEVRPGRKMGHVTRLQRIVCK
ncbi:MAG: 5-(carboxyamino)imidazole ribonucleotide synthase [Rhizobiaceae bacterium]|nr:5-(carboxyamino)imidazole ribonucleotide synthase [Rhizobiaceae bacterium]